MKPTDLEDNKKLAKYAGWEFVEDTLIEGRAVFRHIKNDQLVPFYGKLPLWMRYTESLDAQIPIKKKRQVSCDYYYRNDGKVTFSIHTKDSVGLMVTKDELAQASAYALYYAILEDEK